MLVDKLDTDSEKIIYKAIDNYRQVIQKNYGNQNNLGYIGDKNIEKFLQHIQPIMAGFYATLKSDLSDMQISALEEFLLNFSEIGVNPRIPNLKPNVSLIRLFYNDTFDWGGYRKRSSIVPDPPIEKQLDALSARKLYILSRAGIDKFEDLDEYEKIRMEEGYSLFSSSELPGCFDYSIAWFSKKLDNVPNELVFGLREFYKKIVKPTIDDIDKLKKAIKQEGFSFKDENNYNSDKPYG